MARGSRSDDYDYDYDTDHDDNDDAFSSSDDDELYDIEADTDHASGDNDTREPREAWLDRLHSSLKGRTTGRRLKRELFRSAALSLFGSLLLILLSIAAGLLYPNSRWYGQAIAGATQLTLQHLVAWPQALFSTIALVMVHHWATLVTNTELLNRLCSYYMYACLFLYPFWVWLCVSTFIVFQPVTMFGPYGPGVEAMYVGTLVAVLPYTAAGLPCATNMSYFLSQIREGATVLEPPDEQIHAHNISHMTLEEFIEFIATHEGQVRIDARGRQYRTASGPIGLVLLAGLTSVRRIRAFLSQRVSPGANRQRQRHEEQEITPVAVSNAAVIEDKRPQTHADISAATSLSPMAFQQLWQALPEGGSFECKVAEYILAMNMEQHLKDRGFESRTSDYANAWEITLFNQRQSTAEPWFLGQMTLDSSLQFQATLKCTEEARVPHFVKEFELADVLKISS